jgi:hypothetical protein
MKWSAVVNYEKRHSAQAQRLYFEAYYERIVLG